VPFISKFIKDKEFYIYLYKTIWCPFSMLNHKKDKCIYAHNV